MLTVAETAALLREFDDVLILTHVRPDGDTVGCAAALCEALRGLGKRAYLLHNPEETRTTAPYFAPYKAPEGFVPQNVVSTDVSVLELLPENARAYADRIDLAIDHHSSFAHFAKANIVRPEAAACGELLYDILLEFGPITAAVALPLYVAVSTDTGCFQYGNTTAYTHTVAAELLKTGIDYRKVNKVFFQTKSRKQLALESAMLAAMEFYDHGRTVMLVVPRSLMERVGADESDAEDLSALGGQIEGTDCALTIRELRPSVWKFSVRTGPRINASNVCAQLGGGGHAAAAGCTVEGTLERAKEEILKAVAKTTPDFDPALV